MCETKQFLSNSKQSTEGKLYVNNPELSAYTILQFLLPRKTVKWSIYSTVSFFPFLAAMFDDILQVLEMAKDDMVTSIGF